MAATQRRAQLAAAAARDVRQPASSGGAAIEAAHLKSLSVALGHVREVEVLGMEGLEAAAGVAT